MSQGDTNMLDFVFWDVQCGSAVYARTPKAKHFVVDLGTGSYGSASAALGTQFSPLKHLRDECGVSQLDGLTITHPHRDHLADIFMFDDLSPRALIRPEHIPEKDVRAGNRKEDYNVIDKYLEINARYSSFVFSDDDPYEPSNNGGVVFKTFSPRSADTSQLNNCSITMVVQYAMSTMLITGDNESTAWNELLKRQDFLKAIEGTNILLAAHHGREPGYYADLFEHIKPELTIVSDGRFCDTSAADRYSQHSTGRTVHRRSGGSEKRHCLTTRKDGVITVCFGFGSDQKPFIKVQVD